MRSHAAPTSASTFPATASRSPEAVTNARIVALALASAAKVAPIAPPRSSGHPIVRSAEPGEDWSWCSMKRLAAAVGEGASAVRSVHTAIGVRA